MAVNENRRTPTPRGVERALAPRAVRLEELRDQRTQEHDALLRAARRVFLRRGYRQTRVEDILREAGISTRAFYRFHASKGELFLELFDRANQAAMQRLRASVARPWRRGVTPRRLPRGDARPRLRAPAQARDQPLRRRPERDHRAARGRGRRVPRPAGHDPARDPGAREDDRRVLRHRSRRRRLGAARRARRDPGPDPARRGSRRPGRRSSAACAVSAGPHCPRAEHASDRAPRPYR